MGTGEVGPPAEDVVGRAYFPWVEVLLVAGIALAVRLPHLSSADPWYDEFYHLLAARSWLQDGTFSIGTGEYVRAALFTRIVAGSLAVFGDSIAAGRVPAVVFGVLWVLAVFAWTRHVAGRGAAWAAGLLFAFDPGAIHLSQWVRFYTLEGLLVWIGVVSAYALVTFKSGLFHKLLFAAIGLVALVIAEDLLQSVLIAAAAVALWAAGVLVPKLPRLWSQKRLYGWLTAAGVLAVVAAVVWASASGMASRYWAGYTSTFFWQEGSTRSSRWYAWWLGAQYQTLWSLFPVAMVVAVARFPRPALLALTVWVVSFVMVSFASGQAERYLYFALPFFFVVWGLALAVLVPAIRREGERVLAAVGRPVLPQRARRVAALAFTVLTVAFIASQNDAARSTVRMVFPGDGPRPYREADWRMVLPQLQPLVDSADVVVSSYLLKPLYYFGRGDYHLSWTETAEVGFEGGRPIEFSIDFRTGRPAISASESLARIMDCVPSGLVLTERFHLNRPHLVPEETTEFLRANMVEVPLPPESWVIAYRWNNQARLAGPRCDELGVPASRLESRGRAPGSLRMRAERR